LINIIYKFSTDDKYSLNDEFLTCNFNNYRYTFWNSSLELLPEFPKKEAIDLLMISLAVYGADRIIKRQDTANGWKRNIHLHMPVLNTNKLDQYKDLLKRTVDFLTGDNWEFTFRERKLTMEEIEYRDRMNQIGTHKLNANKLCMFSGGLDSFIGVIDLLESKQDDVILVSHYGGGKGTREYQEALKRELITEYSISENNFYSFYAAPKGGQEETMRSRSFMFFSHAIAIASCFKKRIELIIPENGYISLNIPLTFSRTGTSSTRTTHPHYIELFQELLHKLGIEVSLKNPYQYNTKGEMVANCKNKEFMTKNIINTMSCSHPDVGRMRGESETQHCGTCLPCIIRRSSIKYAGITDKTKYYDKDFLIGATAKTNLNSYLLGLEKHDPARAYLDIQLSGPIYSNIERYESIFKRGVTELKDLLADYYEDN
jgi:7-cyano-7-deazaguanine synthase in queuosine biosynthesis